MKRDKQIQDYYMKKKIVFCLRCTTLIYSEWKSTSNINITGKNNINHLITALNTGWLSEH